LLFWEHILTFIKVFTIYHSWIHPLHDSSLSRSPHSWNSFNRSHFPICTCKYIIFKPYSFSYTLSLYTPPTPTGAKPQIGPVLHFCSPFLKKRQFCLFKIGSFIMTVPCIYVLCPKLVQRLYFSPFYVRCLLMVISKGFKILHFYIGSTSTIFTFLTSFFYPPSLVSDLCLVWPVFHNIACICIWSIFHKGEKTCGLWLSEPDLLHLRWSLFQNKYYY
jgi:hypothetical protein